MLREAHEKLSGCIKKKDDRTGEVWKREGWITLFYSDERHRIQSIKFRKPFSKTIRLYKPFTRTGVFGHGVFTPFQSDRHKEDNSRLLVTEGDFNCLQFWSAAARYAEAAGSDPIFPHACAIGSATAPDFTTIKGISRRPLFIFDNDSAGRGSVEKAREFMTVEAVTTPGEETDLDDFIRSFGDDARAAWEGLRDLFARRTTLERKYEGVAEEIFQVRQKQGKGDCRREFEISNQVAEIVITDLKDRGKFYNDSREGYYFFTGKKRLIAISRDDREFRLTLARYGLNPSEKLFSYVEHDLWVESFEHGAQTEVHRLSYFNTSADALFVFNHDSQIYRITPDKIDLVDNGTDGVIFLTDSSCEPFNADLGQRPTTALLTDLLFNRMNFASDTLSPEERRLICMYYFFSIFFQTLLPTKPLLAFIGPKGSGKSTSLRLKLKILVGPKADLSKITSDEKDFEAVVTSLPFAAFDNVDSGNKWLNNALAICATGGTIRKRKLHTTNELVEYPTRCFIGLTSRTPPLRRDDVSDRTLIMRVNRFEKFKAEKDLVDEVLEHRDEIWSEILHCLQAIVSALCEEKDSIIEQELRMGDFGSFCLKVSRHMGPWGEEIIKSIFHKLSHEQSLFTLENDPIFDLLTEWASKPENSGREITNPDLCQELKALAEEKDTEFTYNTRAFGQRMTHIRSNLEEFFDMTERSVSGRMRAYTYRLKEEIS